MRSLCTASFVLTALLMSLLPVQAADRFVMRTTVKDFVTTKWTLQCPDGRKIDLTKVSLTEMGYEEFTLCLQDIESMNGVKISSRTKVRNHVVQEDVIKSETVMDAMQASKLCGILDNNKLPFLPFTSGRGRVQSLSVNTVLDSLVIDLGDGRWGFVVADVADKGTGAALYMALSRTLIRTYALEFPDRPATALEKANDRILADTEAEQFVTVFYGVLDPETGRLVYANAGHNPGLIFSGRQPTPIRELPNTGMPLGIFENSRWEQKTITLGSEDMLLIYTDGLAETPGVNEEMFGVDRIIATVRSAPDRTAPAIRTLLLENLRGFSRDGPLFDDVTLMVIARQRPEENREVNEKSVPIHPALPLSSDE